MYVHDFFLAVVLPCHFLSVCLIGASCHAHAWPCGSARMHQLGVKSQCGQLHIKARGMGICVVTPSQPMGYQPAQRALGLIATLEIMQDLMLRHTCMIHEHCDVQGRSCSYGSTIWQFRTNRSLICKERLLLSVQKGTNASIRMTHKR